VSSALGGALGALALKITFKAAVVFQMRRTPLATYNCATSGTKPGQFGHCYGHAVEEDGADVKKRRNGKVWEHNWKKIDPIPPHRPIGKHTLFGCNSNTNSA
jgi:hypothetical protein